MKLDRLVERMGTAITLLVAACAAYGVAAFVLGFVPAVELEPDQSIPRPTGERGEVAESLTSPRPGG